MGQYYSIENIIARYAENVAKKREDHSSLLQDIAESFGVTSTPKANDVESFVVRGGVVA